MNTVKPRTIAIATPAVPMSGTSGTTLKDVVFVSTISSHVHHKKFCSSRNSARTVHCPSEVGSKVDFAHRMFLQL